MRSDDLSTEFMIRFWPWFDANRKRLIVLGVVVLVALLVWFYLKTSQESHALAAGQAYTQFQLNQPKTESAQQVAEGYQNIARDYSGTLTAQRAQLQAAEILFSAGNYAAAQTQFENFLKANATSPLAGTARLGVGACQESQGKLADALATYRQVKTGYPSTAEGINANFSSARVLELQGKLADAISAYQEVMNSPLAGSLASEAANRAALLKVRLAAQTEAAQPAATPAVQPAPKKS